ncbi:discoidin domain-containing protein [Micromonospora sp. BRA006-A]|nr:discoidin domain-containing protein [Micromonospora sp. BRA006-A]
MSRPVPESSVLAAVGLVVTAAPAPPALAAGGPNLAAGRTATASSVNGPYVAAHLTDGNQGSYWESSGALPQWAQVDLGTSRAVDQVVPSSWPPGRPATRRCPCRQAPTAAASPQSSPPPPARSARPLPTP